MSAQSIYGRQLNNNLKALHRALIKQQRVVLNKVSQARTSDEADALIREMHEINFRVMICGSLLFKQTSAALDANLTTVVDATDQLEAAIKSADTIAAVIRSTSKLLGLVDKVLDLVKLG